MNLREVIQAFLDHRRVVLLRRSNFRLSKIEDRLEILSGLLVAHLNIDEVIRIVRFEDHPKAQLIKAFKLTERQAEAILNMRLRALNKLKEFELQSEHDELSAEKADIEDLLSSESRQWSVIADQVRALRETYSLKTEVGARRTRFEDQPDIDVDIEQAMITKEPITVVLSEKGWIRAMKGKLDKADGLKFKEGDKLAYMVPAETTDKIILFASNGKFYTLAGDKLPGGRGNGEPVRLLLDLPDDHVPIGLFVHNPERRLLVASSEGYGFAVNESDVTALKRGGKQVLNVKGDVEAIRCIEIRGEKIAVIGENRKILIYNTDEIPVMGRGKGVRLQKYKDGGLADITTFKADDGLTFTDSSNRTQSVNDWQLLDGKRAQAGRMAPRGFARSGRFAPDKRLS
jgi:topoisomerase-4 subunit A